MVLSSNLRRVDWNTLPEVGSLGSSENYGEWLSFGPVAGGRLNVTVCFAAFNMGRQFVHTTAETTLREPETSWALTSQKYDTSDVRKFLGIDVPHRPHGERGVLTMDILGEPDDGPPGSLAHDIVTLNGSHGTENHTIADLTTRALEELVDYALSRDKVTNVTLLLCYSCDGLAEFEHPVLAMLFTSIIAETGGAANALSSCMTVIGSTWYDEYRSSMKGTQKATIIMTKIVRTQWALPFAT
jgi:hypothetical protein